MQHDYHKSQDTGHSVLYHHSSNMFKLVIQLTNNSSFITSHMLHHSNNNNNNNNNKHAFIYRHLQENQNSSGLQPKVGYKIA